MNHRCHRCRAELTVSERFSWLMWCPFCEVHRGYRAAVVPLIALLLLTGCSTVRVTDPQTGAELRIRGDIGLATSGNLGDTGGGLTGMFQNRSTQASQESTLNSDSSLEFGALTMTGLTVNRTSPAAVTWRGLTGTLRQAKQLLWGKWSLQGRRDVQLAREATATQNATTAAGVERAGIRAGVERARIDTIVPLAELAE